MNCREAKIEPTFTFRLVSKIATIEPGNIPSTETFFSLAGPKRRGHVIANTAWGTSSYYAWFGSVAARCWTCCTSSIASCPTTASRTTPPRCRVADRLGRGWSLGAQKMQELQPRSSAFRKSTRADGRPAPSRSRICSANTITIRWPAARRCSCSCRFFWGCFARWRSTSSCCCAGSANRSAGALGTWRRLTCCGILGEYDGCVYRRSQRLAGPHFLLAVLDDRAVHPATENVTPCRRAGCHAAEGHAIHDDLHWRATFFKVASGLCLYFIASTCGALPSASRRHARARLPPAPTPQARERVGSCARRPAAMAHPTRRRKIATVA